jgi:hypothetical protein
MSLKLASITNAESQRITRKHLAGNYKTILCTITFRLCYIWEILFSNYKKSSQCICFVVLYIKQTCYVDNPSFHFNFNGFLSMGYKIQHYYPHQFSCSLYWVANRTIFAITTLCILSGIWQFRNKCVMVKKGKGV